MDNFFGKYNIKINSEQEEKFELYFSLLTEYNQKFNLTAITDREGVYYKHFIDSLLCIDKIGCGKLVDIGSGGGFPAIPIKIMKADLDVTLIEATGKKCEFLKTVSEKLCLEKVTVLHGRAEDFAKNALYREKYDFCKIGRAHV